MDIGFYIVFTIFIISLTYQAILAILSRKETQKIHDIISNTSLFLDKNNSILRINPEKIDENIDKLIDRHIEQYMFDNELLINVESNYLGEREINEMIREVCKIIITNLSDYYFHLIKVITYIPSNTLEEVIDGSDEYLTEFIYNKVKSKVLDLSVNYNTEQEDNL